MTASEINEWQRGMRAKMMAATSAKGADGMNMMNMMNDANQYSTSNSQAIPTPRESVFSGFEPLMGDANNVAARASALAERLCGFQPEKGDGASSQKPAPNGVFEALGVVQHDIRAALIRALAAIERIESKLP